MPMQLHMTIEGEKQGAIDGPCKIKGREKTFVVLDLSHSVTLPFDSTTHDVTGLRQHSPLAVTKQVDEASPALYEAIKGGEHLTVEIQWYRPHPDGGAADQHYFTTKLEKAKLASISPLVPSIGEASAAATGHLEQLAFMYKTITWTFEGGGETIDDVEDRG
jgi:type VI secretion system secreted protein Hcp